MNENVRLAEIVEAVKELEHAITKDSGVPSKQQCGEPCSRAAWPGNEAAVHLPSMYRLATEISYTPPQVHLPAPSPLTVMRPQVLRESSYTPSSTPPPRSHLAHPERSGIGDRTPCEQCSYGVPVL